MSNTSNLLCLVLLLALPASAKADEDATGPGIRVPASTAYSEPDPDAVRFSPRTGITGWTDAGTRIVWYGYLAKTGILDVLVMLRQPQHGAERLRLTVGKQERTAKVSGGGDSPIGVDFGSVTIPAAGYYRFQLEGLEREGASFGDLISLQLTGTAAQDAHFNLEERRNAASVHLGYPVASDAKVQAFYNEVTVRTDPIWSYYMACGFQRGYFGIQVNSPTERRIIFSVWDSGSEANDRKNVAPEDRVQLLAKGEGVTATDFGNEGTGGHSHLVYPWKTGATYRFLVTAARDGDHTTYSGYFYFTDMKRWGLIARFRAPKDGGTLRGLYSFNENFGGANGHLRRVAEYGNQWIMTADKKWIELTTARFTHDPTGRENRRDYSAGTMRAGFYLSNGGFVNAGSIRYGDTLQRAASNRPPRDIPAAILP